MSDFIYKIGENVKDTKRDMIITDRKYIRDKGGVNRKHYKYKCNKCGFECGKHYYAVYKKTRDEFWVKEDGLRYGHGCISCDNKAITSINNIWNNQRWMCSLGLSEEDAKTHTKGSGDKVEVACPDCGKKRMIIVANIYKYKTISCGCSDKTKYPEKFIINVLNQLEECFDFHATNRILKWCNDKEYDFYLHKYNMIIEAHGMQHYEGKGRGRSLEEEQENDRLKKELALKHGIKHYIVIDCRYSEMNWIKNNILNSELSRLFDLSKIDWSKCEEFALSNLVKKVCEYKKNNPNISACRIAEIFGIHKTTTIRYLKRGTKLGWCYYDGKEEMKKSGTNQGIKNGKKVEVFKNGISLGVFYSFMEMERQSEEKFGVKLWATSARKVCDGEQKMHKNFKFKYA